MDPAGVEQRLVGYQLFAQSPPFAHLNAVYNNFDFDGPLNFVRNAAGLSDKVMESRSCSRINLSKA